MPLFGSILGGKKADAPAANPDDTVYPVHTLDGCKANHVATGWVLRFDDVLDADKLRSSLVKTLEIGDWKKLGGKIRRGDKGKLEIHAPKEFTDETPGIQFTHDTTHASTSINDHPLAKTTLHPTATASIQPLSNDLRAFQATSDHAETIDGLITNDQPQISLLVTSFNDATILGLTWTYMTLDTYSFGSLLRAWSLVLAGKEADVPSVLDGAKDVLLEQETAEDKAVREQPKLEEKRVAGLKLMKLFSKVMWEKGQKAGKELRGAYIPAGKFAALQTKVKSEEGADSSISETDILAAWTTHLLAKQEAKPRPFVLTSLFNGRDKIPSVKEGGDKKGIHLQNMQLMSATFLTEEQTSSLSSGSMASIAAEYRRQDAELTTEKQTLALARKYRSEVEAGSDAPRIYAESTDSVMVLMFPLLQAGMLQAADFSAAVVEGSGGSGKAEARVAHKPGAMVSYFSQPLSWTSTGLDAVYFLGKDCEGGVWVMGRLAPETWTLMGEELEAL